MVDINELKEFVFELGLKEKYVSIDIILESYFIKCFIEVGYLIGVCVF